MLNNFALLLTHSITASLQEAVVVDHGHGASSGEAHVSFSLKPLPPLNRPAERAPDDAPAGHPAEVPREQPGEHQPAGPPAGHPAEVPREQPGEHQPAGPPAGHPAEVPCEQPGEQQPAGPPAGLPRKQDGKR
eukprot:13738771-Heterocapsa_arctica.AAC.1